MTVKHRLLHAAKILLEAVPALQDANNIELAGCNPPRFINKRLGICNNLRIIAFCTFSTVNIDTEDGVLHDIFTRYPDYSGHPRFPIRDTAKDCPAKAFFNEHKNMWIGQYGESRIALLQFIIEELSRELDVAP